MVARVRRTISRYELFKPLDRIAVAVSGGKDSLSLLKILLKIEREYPRASLVAVAVDEGIPEYRDEAIKHAQGYSEKLRIPLHVTSFKELYGFTLTEAVESGAAESLSLHPCTICGVLRRKALTIMARRVGATVLATAHTLDDIVQTYLLNLMRGDTRMKPIGVRREADGIIPRAAPFRLIPEREVVYYAYMARIPFQTHTCPYAQTSMRDPIRRFLTEYEERFPGTLYATLNAIERTLTREEREENRCQICGEPTARKICRACELEAMIKERMIDS